MVYVTGDTHGRPDRFDVLETRQGADAWGEDDVLIVCGDFGYLFANDAAEHAFLDRLAEKPYTVCFCDGNHENFAALNALPKERMWGGNVHKLRKNVIHLMRGQVYRICGRSFFVMGGAYSIDRYMRLPGESYWDEELPSGEEYREAIGNLRECGSRVDYIVTHTAPREVIRLMGFYPTVHDMELSGFFDWIAGETAFERWFFGHWHTDRDLGRFRALWFDLEPLEETRGKKPGEET